MDLDLVSDCSRCVGLCCVALPFGRSADFAFDKAPGERCRHLASDASCGIHDRLRPSGMPGCTVYECFGAGQQVVQVTFGGRPPPGATTYAVFHTVRALHEMLVLLEEARSLAAGDRVRRAGELTTQVLAARDADPEVLAATDVSALRGPVGALLGEVSAAVRGPGGDVLPGADLVGQDLRRRDLRSADLRGALLLAADLRGSDLGRADLLGCDLRDARLDGADLSRSLFLTQPQVNAARGSAATGLPGALRRPPHWG